MKSLGDLVSPPVITTYDCYINLRIIFAGDGGISIGYDSGSYDEPETHHVPRSILIGDNFNRVIGTERWGRETRVDVFHVMAKIQEVFAPPELSRVNPRVPITSLTGQLSKS